MKISITSQSFAGSLLIGYDPTGRLVQLIIDADLSEIQYKWLMINLPTNQTDLEAVLKAMKAKSAVVPTDTSFDAFWEAFAKKINRLRCVPMWAKLSEADRTACLASIKPYDNFLRRANGRAKLDPENYLKRRSWESNWNSL